MPQPNITKDRRPGRDLAAANLRAVKKFTRCMSSTLQAALLQEQAHGRGLQQLPPLPVALPLPPFLTGNGGGGGGLLGSLLGGLQGGSLPSPRQPQPSLQTQPQPRANASASGGCTATFAGVLASQPDLFFISSALGMSGFQNSLPSPSLGLTIFAPNNAGFLKLLDNLSAYPLPNFVHSGLTIVRY